MRKREDTAEGCRELALDDRARAADVVGSEHMRRTLERSAGCGSRGRSCSSGSRRTSARGPRIRRSNNSGRSKGKAMAKGQIRSNKEARKPKAKGAKKGNASNPSRKP